MKRAGVVLLAVIISLMLVTGIASAAANQLLHLQVTFGTLFTGSPSGDTWQTVWNGTANPTTRIRETIYYKDPATYPTVQNPETITPEGVGYLYSGDPTKGYSPIQFIFSEANGQPFAKARWNDSACLPGPMVDFNQENNRYRVSVSNFTGRHLYTSNADLPEGAMWQTIESKSGHEVFFSDPEKTSVCLDISWGKMTK